MHILPPHHWGLQSLQLWRDICQNTAQISFLPRRVSTIIYVGGFALSVETKKALEDTQVAKLACAGIQFRELWQHEKQNVQEGISMVEFQVMYPIPLAFR
jgi:hypothetical protein